MSFLSRDGLFIVYQLQGKWKKTSKAEWEEVGYAWFGIPPVGSDKSGFSSNGDCWQRTGLHGTFEQDIGYQALTAMREKWPTYQWRLIRRTMMQNTEVCNDRAHSRRWAKVSSSQGHAGAEQGLRSPATRRDRAAARSRR